MVQVDEDPEPFGEQIWKAKPNGYKLFDNCVYRVYQADTGILLATRSAGTTVTVTATYTAAAGDSITGTFNLSQESNTVIKQEYEGNGQGGNGVFAVDIFRWRAGGSVLVDPAL